MVTMKECETIINKAIMEKRFPLWIDEAQRICTLHRIPTPKYEVTTSVDEAVKKAGQIGYPVVLKVISPQIIHKSEFGAVIVNIADEKDLRIEYEKLIAEVHGRQPSASITGVLIEQMMPPSTEVIVGAIRDNQFGPAVMFGMGGIFAEMYDDVKFRVAPIDKTDALNMVRGLRGSRILEGSRGHPPLDTDSLVNVLMRVSELMMEHSAIEELDLNPVIAYSRGSCAVDSRIIITGKKEDA
jgi:acyl-CoA synthetase (NDP forming)